MNIPSKKVSCQDQAPMSIANSTGRITPERIKQAIEGLHRRKPGKILSAMEIYEAIAQAQYDEDIKEVTSGNCGENTNFEE